MIKIERSPAPDVLTKPDGAGNKENRKALAHYADPAKRQKSFDFKVYKHDKVKTALNKLFHFKCAYCESRFGPTAPVDVEHFRPKLAVECADGRLIKPGYYWLAADWDNLLPSCIDCNRARIHEHAEENDSKLSGKANLFPINNDLRSNLDPGAEAGEDRLLLHPCQDDVETFFKYLHDKAVGVLISSAQISVQDHARAESSIDIYGLNRLLLVRERGDYYIRLVSQINLVAKCLKLLFRSPDDVDLQGDLAAAICELKALEADDASYAGMNRFCLKSVHPELKAKLEEILGNRLDAFNGENIVEKLTDKFPCPEHRGNIRIEDLDDLFN